MLTEDFRVMQKAVNDNAVAHGFWTGPANIGEKLALVHSEISEALEETRKHEFNKSAFGEELADAVIRIMDISQMYDIDLFSEIIAKHNKNLARPYKHGKLY